MSAVRIWLAVSLLLPWAGVAADSATGPFKVCYDFGCQSSQQVTLSAEEWKGVANWFVPAPADAAEERERIRNAIGWIEVLVGNHTPTSNDRARNELLPSQAPGQQDCIDESLNTTTYLRLLEKDGLLHFHRVLDRAYRRALLDQHWAGRLEEFDSGERWVVDSWFRDNGYLPFVQHAREWKKIRYFRTSYDSTF
ncbi:MAG: hypothetical protein LJE84_03170 [Gammaproteobacteria bacterium]|nr:hypothetical protein [Gammaproteobacteria bacterium]